MLTDLAEFGTPLRVFFLHLPRKFRGLVRSGHGVMTSYMTSCSGEICGFFDLSYLGELYFFLEWVFALQAALMVLRDTDKPYTVAPGSRSRKVTHSMGRFRSPFDCYFFLTLQLS